MTFGPFTGWKAGQKVHLKEKGAMACLTSHRKITTSIPVPLTLVSLEAIQTDVITLLDEELWLTQATDGGFYCAGHRSLVADT